MKDKTRQGNHWQKLWKVAIVFRHLRDENGKISSKKVGYYSKSAIAVVISLAVLIGGFVIVGKFLSDKWYEYRTMEDYLGDGKEEVIVTIPEGSSISEIGNILVSANVVKSQKAFRIAAAENPKSESIQTGRYQLRTEIPAATAVSWLLDPNYKVVLKVTFPEGTLLYQQHAIAEEKLGISPDAFSAALTNPTEIGLPEYAQGQLEGFFFPDTYQVSDQPTAAELLKLQTAQFVKVADELNLVAKAQELGLSPLQVVTVASLVEKEARLEEDRPKVAGVIYNRLKLDMKLELDSTVHYAARSDNGKITTTDEERNSDSPYNTYKFTGLPPGPIANPGRAALQAALNPANIEELYFVTVNPETGETKFSKTFEEHKEYQAEFQRWCQDHPGAC